MKNLICFFYHFRKKVGEKMPKVYISPSTQEHNIGVGDYGTEEKRMNDIADLVYEELKQYPIEVFRNKPEMRLGEVVKDSNEKKVDLHCAIHSNAASTPLAQGTSCFYHYKGSAKSKEFANIIYNNIAPISPGKDRGVKPDNTLYDKGLYELRETNAPASLIELDFHTNVNGAKWIIEEKVKISKAIVKSILEYFDIGNYEENHWANEHFNNLNKKGIKIYEKRFDEYITRGEALALLDRATDK